LRFDNRDSVVIVMWYMGRKSKPELGIVSGPEGWKTKEQCDVEILAMNQEIIRLAKQDLRIIAETRGTDSIGAQWAAKYLDEKVKIQFDYIPIEVNK